MLPLPLAFGPYEVTPYDLAHWATVVLAVWLGVRLNRHQGIPAYVTLAVAGVAVIAAHVGARFLDMLEYPRAFSIGDLLTRGASSIYGAFFFVLPVLLAGPAVFRVPLLRFLDGAAPVLALAEASTRVGCFLAGCCYGVEW